MAADPDASSVLEAIIQGTLDINESHLADNSTEPTDDKSLETEDTNTEACEDEQALEWHEVIELQAFSERKAWIEEKIKFLEKLPPIEVFAGLDAVRSSAGEVPGLPTRAALQEWIAEHDRIEKETEIFDSGELKKLKKFTKAAAQRNLSPADTDLIELTLTTIYALDKLLHLLRDRSENLDLLGLRLTWEERRINSWAELRSVLADIRPFLITRARWSPAVYDAVTAEDEVTVESTPVRKRRDSIVSVASVSSMVSDSSCLNAPGFSRSARYKLAEVLTRDAAQFVSRVSTLRHTKIAGAGKALDKLIDHSRRPVPDELLDEQDKLEDQGINEMEDVGKFVLGVVMQWKKADEVYVETMKDKASAQSLLEEVEMAQLSHPTSRQDSAFLSRANALMKRLALRQDPMSPASTFPCPSHALFPDQAESNEGVMRLLSSEIASANSLVRKIELATKEYHATLEAVKRVEAACKASSGLSSQYQSIADRLTNGITTDDGDGSPPDLTTEACLQIPKHAFYLTALPSIFQELKKVDEDATDLTPKARLALLQADRPGVDAQFKADSSSEVERLATLQRSVAGLREDVASRVSTLNSLRQVWSVMGEVFTELDGVQCDIAESTERQMWRQQLRTQDAPPTPESPSTPLPPMALTPSATAIKLDGIDMRIRSHIASPLHALSLAAPLADYLGQCEDGLSSYLSHIRRMVRFWESVCRQSSAMENVRDEVHGLQVQTEDLKVRFDTAIQDVFSGTLSGDQLLLTEGGLSSDLKRSQDALHVFMTELPQRVPFVEQVQSSGYANNSAGRLSSPGGFGLELIKQGSSTGFAIEPAALNRGVRADSNAYSMMLSGSLKAVEARADHFQLAKTAKAVDLGVESVLVNIRRVTDAAASIQMSLDDPSLEGRVERLSDLSYQVDQLLQSDGAEITRSMSPIRGLLHRMHSMSESGIPEGIAASRQRIFDDVERKLSTWKDNVAVLQQAITSAQEAERVRLAEEQRQREDAERARLAEKQRLREEKELREAEERALAAKAEEERLERLRSEEEARLAAEKAECERVERERVERERQEAERLEREREREEKEERQRAEFERQETERLKQEQAEQERLAAEQTVASAVLETVQESQAEAPGPQEENDVFGLQVAASPMSRTRSQHASDLRGHILSLRKRLRSIHINDVARPSARGDLSLPTDEQRKRIAAEFSAVLADASSLPTTYPDDASIDVELRSLRSELDATVPLMQAVHKLADLTIALHLCDNALSDLLEHIDSYPSPPLGALAAPHTSDPSLTPEEQLSTRLDFTRGVIADMAASYSLIADDPRAKSEHDRVLQTWSELEAMGVDRVNGAKSRPASAMSSGRSSVASARSARSTNSQNPPTSRARRLAGYSNLSVGSSGDRRFLAPPPPNTRRTASGSSMASSHSRTFSKSTVASATRSVSGPGPMSSSSGSSTLYGSTFASRQRTTSVSSTASGKTPSRQPHITPSRPRAQTGHTSTPRIASPAFSEISSLSISRGSANMSSAPRSSWARAPRQSFPTVIRSPPRALSEKAVKKPYVANPQNKLDVAVGDVVNKLPVTINVEVVADTWKDQSGKYWIGDQDPKLCFCRILRSQTVMVRVGGGWSELSKFIKEHFAEVFRILPDSPPRMGSREEKWISSATLSQAAAEHMTPPMLPRTPEPKDSYIPSFSLSTPGGTSPRSVKTPSSPGSPLTPMQFLRRADRDMHLSHHSSTGRPETPSKMSSRPNITSILSTPVRQPAWRP